MYKSRCSVKELTREIRGFSLVLGALSAILGAIGGLLGGNLLDGSCLLGGGLLGGKGLLRGGLGLGLGLRLILVSVLLLLYGLLGGSALLLGRGALITIDSGSLGTTLLTSGLGRGSDIFVVVAIVSRELSLVADVVGLEKTLVSLLTVKL